MSDWIDILFSGKPLFLVIFLAVVPAYFLSLLVPFFFLAAWMARKPPKFIEQDKSLGIYMAVAGAIGTALQLVSPSVSGIGWALWIMFWGLMLIWASIKRAAPQSAAS